MNRSSARAVVQRATLAKAFWRRFGHSGYQPLPRPEIMRSRSGVRCSPALFDPDQLSRVRAVPFGKNIQGEVDKLTATRFIEAPCECYRLGPAIIAGGSIITGLGTHYFGPRSASKASLSPLQEIDEAHLVTSEQGLKYFGHWLRDDCTMYELLREMGHSPYAMCRPDWPDIEPYESAFRQPWPALDFARINRLHVYRELGFNLDKARRIRKLRARLRAAHAQHAGGHIVYLRRGTIGSPRDMSNTEAFEGALARAGIRLVTPASDPKALIEALMNARMIITIEGSQAAHGVYTLAQGGAMLILQSPDRFYNPHHEWARLIGMGYGTIVGKRDETSFHVDPDEVLAMVDRLDSTILSDISA